MDIGKIANDAVRYPSSDWKKMIILGIILIIPIVNFIGSGYLLRIIKATFAGIDEQPDFDELGELFVDGVKVFVVSIVYSIIPVIVILLGVFGSLSFISAGTVTDPTALIGLLGGTVIIGLILAIIFGIFEIIAIANMALYDELGAAFRFSEILKRISMIGWANYIIWLIVMFIIAIVAGIIASIIGVLNLIGVPLGTIIALITVYPYLYMVFARALALLFASSEENVAKPAETPEPAEE